MTIEYEVGAEFPDAQLTWLDSTGAPVDFSTGYTFTALVGQSGAVATVTKTTGVTGAAVAPNVVVAWASGELDGLVAGAYSLRVIANHTASGRDRSRSFPMTITTAVTPV